LLVFRNNKPTTSVFAVNIKEYDWLVHQPITPVPRYTIRTVSLQSECHYTHCPTTGQYTDLADIRVDRTARWRQADNDTRRWLGRT